MMKKHFEIYATGLLHTSVCTNLTIEEATERLNKELPTGISNGWQLHEGDFADGHSNSCVCEENTNYKHYLFSC